MTRTPIGSSLRGKAAAAVDSGSLLLVNATTGGGVDGIDAYSRRLTGALVDLGARAALITRRDQQWQRWLPEHEASGPLGGSSAVIRELREADTLVLQYNPFSWGPRGFAPGLLRMLNAIKRRPGSPRLSVMLHERYMPRGTARETLMSVWQRFQLAAITRLVDQGFVSTDAWVGLDCFGATRRHSTLLPVGSNLPDARQARAVERERLDLGAEALVLATFGTNHPSRRMEHVVTAANAVARLAPVTLLNLGAESPPLAGLAPPIRCVTPGRISDEGVASLLAAADIYLAPFVDGVSTRRTTLAAALQHSLPVVGTRGTSTGERLGGEPAFRLVPAYDAGAFADAVVRLAMDPADRAHRSQASRALYDDLFAWPRIAQQLLDELDPSLPPASAITTPLGGP